MIVVFYGARDSGKTTLCKLFHSWLRSETNYKKIHYIDSDKIKYVFSKGQTMYDIASFGLHDRAVICARYEESLNEVVLMAMPFPTQKERDLLSDHPNTLWLYLKDINSARELKNKKPIIPFEEPSDQIIDTGLNNEIKTLDIVIEKFKQFTFNQVMKN